MIPRITGNGDARPSHFQPAKPKSKEQLLEAAKSQLEQKPSMGARSDASAAVATVQDWIFPTCQLLALSAALSAVLENSSLPISFLDAYC